MIKSPKVQKPEDDEETGRQLFGWLERPGAAFLVILGLASVGVASLFIEALLLQPSGVGPLKFWGSHALIGSISLTALFLAARALRKVISRDADYYEADDE